MNCYYIVEQHQNQYWENVGHVFSRKIPIRKMSNITGKIKFPFNEFTYDSDCYKSHNEIGSFNCDAAFEYMKILSKLQPEYDYRVVLVRKDNNYVTKETLGVKNNP